MRSEVASVQNGEQTAAASLVWPVYILNVERASDVRPRIHKVEPFAWSRGSARTAHLLLEQWQGWRGIEMNFHQTDYAQLDVCGVQSCAVLNKYLTASLVMRCRIEQARSRVRGPGLSGVEEMFDRVSRETERIAKAIAERAEYLSGAVQGKKPLGPMALQTWPYLLGIAGEKQQIIDAWEALASFAQLIRDDTRQISKLNDPDTEDLFIAVLEEVEQELEFIEAQLAQQ